MIESFSESNQLAKVKSGFKGGPLFRNPLTPQKMTFVDGYPAEYGRKIQDSMKAPRMGIEDAWVNRRSNSSMK